MPIPSTMLAAAVPSASSSRLLPARSTSVCARDTPRPVYTTSPTTNPAAAHTAVICTIDCAMSAHSAMSLRGSKTRRALGRNSARTTFDAHAYSAAFATCVSRKNMLHTSTTMGIR